MVKEFVATNRGRVFQGVEYPSRRDACQARHREYVRALADCLNFTQAAHAVVGGSFRAGCSGVGASRRVLRLSLVAGAGPAVSTSPPEGLGDSLSSGLPQFRMQFPRGASAPYIHIVGIATFVEFVECSGNRIACEIVWSVPRQSTCPAANPPFVGRSAP